MPVSLNIWAEGFGHWFRKPEVKGSSPFAGSIEIKQLQAPSGCLFWFVDTDVDRLGTPVPSSSGVDFHFTRRRFRGGLFQGGVED
jgi:hypothetical protein